MLTDFFHRRNAVKADKHGNPTLGPGWHRDAAGQVVPDAPEALRGTPVEPSARRFVVTYRVGGKTMAVETGDGVEMGNTLARLPQGSTVLRVASIGAVESC